MRPVKRKEETAQQVLGDICSLHSGVVPSRSRDGRLAEYPLLRAGDLRRVALVRSDLETHQIGETASERAQLRVGDIVMARIFKEPSIRVVGADLAGCVAGNQVIIVRPRHASVSQRDLVGLFSSREFAEFVRQHASSIGGHWMASISSLIGAPVPRGVTSKRPEVMVARLVADLARKLVRLVADDANVLWSIEWRDVERVIALACEGLGFDVTLTKTSRDGGKDVMLSCDEGGVRKSYVIELKHWVSGKRVPASDLRKFIAVIAREEHNGGLFLSTSGFSREAFSSPLHLEDRVLRVAGARKMSDLCRTFVMVENGLWTPKGEADGVMTRLLFAGTDAVS